MNIIRSDANVHLSIGANVQLVATKNHSRLLIAASISIFLLLALTNVIRFGPTYSPDSYVYLDVAAEFIAGNAGKTNIIYYDTERQHNTVPTPLTTFPAGYGLASAMASVSGLPIEMAAVGVSMISLALVIFIANQLLMLARPDISILLLFNVVLVTNSYFLLFASSIISEPLFTLFCLVSIYFLARVLTEPPEFSMKLMFLIVAHIFIGLAYWTRYAGLFLFLGVALFHGILFAKYRSLHFFRLGIFTLISFAIIAAGLLRNYLLVGSWRGGNTKSVEGSFFGAFFEIPKFFYYLIFGDKTAFNFGFFEATLLLAAGVAVALFVSKLSRYKNHALKKGPVVNIDLLILIISVVVVYSAVMAFAGSSSMISYGPRMFFPIFPLVLVFIFMIAVQVVGENTRVRQVLCTVIAMSYLGINVKSTAIPTAAPPHVITNKLLQVEQIDGRNILEWLMANIDDSNPVIANRGSSLHYLLQRPVIGLTKREYTETDWDEAGLRGLIQQFNAEYILIFKSDTKLFVDYPYLDALVNGHLPADFETLVDSESLVLYHVTAG